MGKPADQRQQAPLRRERPRDLPTHSLYWACNDRDMTAKSEVHIQAPIDAGALPEGHGIPVGTG